MPKIWVVVPSAGSGSRMGAKVHKQFLCLREKEILAWTLEIFQEMPEIEGIVLVCSKEDKKQCESLLEKYGLIKVRFVVEGGATRQESVYRGLCAVPKDCTIVLIHDGARPFVKKEQVLATIRQAEKSGGALLAVPVKDTIKVMGQNNCVADTPERSTLYAAQTPQTFRFDEIIKAHEAAYRNGDTSCTDDSQIMERYGDLPVAIVEGSYENFKITTPVDLILAEEMIHE